MLPHIKNNIITIEIHGPRINVNLVKLYLTKINKYFTVIIL